MARTKEEILGKVCKNNCRWKDGTWEQAMDHATYKELTGLVHDAMDEYAKQEAIGFGIWKEEHGWRYVKIRDGGYKWAAIMNKLSPFFNQEHDNLEQLYNLYQQSKQS